MGRTKKSEVDTGKIVEDSKEKEVTISVEDFVNQYTEAKIPAVKEKIISSTIRRSYVPIMEKYTALAVVFGQSHRNSDGMFKTNSIVYYISSVLTTVSLYTNIDINVSKLSANDTYDMLRECGALKDIISVIPANELEELKNISEMLMTDAMNNELNPKAYISAQMTKIAEALKVVMNNENMVSLIETIKDIYRNQQ